jgi:hypothetical protein
MSKNSKRRSRVFQKRRGTVTEINNYNNAYNYNNCIVLLGNMQCLFIDVYSIVSRREGAGEVVAFGDSPDPSGPANDRVGYTSPYYAISQRVL